MARNAGSGKRCLSVLLAGALLLTGTLPAAAADTKGKEEVVYANLASDGGVEEVYVVNIFRRDGGGAITDHGAYTDLRNMTTTDPIRFDNGLVQVETQSDTLYYEGYLPSAELPGKLNIQYRLDGETLPAEQLAGRSGKLEIELQIRRNPLASDSVFFDSYALQASVSLDTKLCENIVTEGATTANVGGDKQLTYTILPGQDKDIRIAADVHDFAMESIAINGVRLSLGMDVDMDALQDQLDELIDGAAQLDDGANGVRDGVSDVQSAVRDDLKDGTEDLHTGANTARNGAEALQEGAHELLTGARELDGGLSQVQSGVSQVQAGAYQLDGKSGDLVGGAVEFRDGLAQLQSEVQAFDPSALGLSDLQNTIAQFGTKLGALVSGLTQLKTAASVAGLEGALSLSAGTAVDLSALSGLDSDAVTQLSGIIDSLNHSGDSEKQALAAQLQNIVTLLQQNAGGLSGIEAYMTGLESSVGTMLTEVQSLQTQLAAQIGSLLTKLNGLTTKLQALQDGVDLLATKYAELLQGVSSYAGGMSELKSGLDELSGGLSRLTSGSRQLVDGAETLDEGLTELTDGLTALYDGSGELDEGMLELLDGLAALYDGTVELADGTGTLRERTDDMQDEVGDQIDDLLHSLSGEGEPVRSFVSAENGEVDAVQFVLKTGPIEAEETAPVSSPEEPALNWWQKLLRLFGLY